MMEHITKHISVTQFQNMIEILNPSMDDFLYIFDLKNDFYSISPSAVERFSMDECQFHNTQENFDKFVYPADRKALTEDIQKVRRGEKSFHNIQYRWLGKDGKAVWINCRGQVTLDENGQPEFLVGCINEIGKKQKADNISGLLRETSLQQSIVENSKKGRMSGFLLRVGIDHFKEINENRGMDYGDMILQRTAECIEAVIEPDQQLYRIVADEFAIVDFNGRTAEEAKRLYHMIRMEIDRFIEENCYEVFYTLSAGILELEQVQIQDCENLLKLSEFALTEAKNRGRNQSYIYVREDYEKFQRKRKLLSAMRRAINNNFEGFETHFQPIVDIKNECLSTAEILLRFSMEELGRVSPMEFIPLLEESGLIIPVGRWVLRKAMEACSQIQKDIPNFRVSVNLSYIQVQKSNVLADIYEGMREFQLKPGSIIVELTESGFLESDSAFAKFCNGLKENGILLALDDFGTGYSNFHYLYTLSPDTIKIDRSFTVKALGNDHEYNILRYMVEMAHSIELKLCVEGIETKDELTRICQMRPDYIQGYYFGKPCTLETFVSEHVGKNLEKNSCSFSNN